MTYLEEDRSIYVYDWEALYDFACVTFVDRDSDRKFHFRWGQDYNQTQELCDFLDQCCDGLVGYNNLNYDWPITNFVYWKRKMFLKMNGEDVAREINKFSQQIITQKYSAIRNPRIQQLDIFRVHHFDNKNKAVSLKALQIAMNWPLVADMPVDHTEFSQGEDWMDKVEEYNLNDVLSTKHFYLMSKKDIELRRELGAIYHIDLMNASEAKIGEQMILHRVAQILNTSPEWLKERGGTLRQIVPISECLLPIEFNNRKFREIYERFGQVVYKVPVEGEEKEKRDENLLSLYDNGVHYDLGFGGIHGLSNTGVEESDNESVIVSADVTSYYPRMLIVHAFCPAHLGKALVVCYEEMWDERVRKPKKKFPTENYSLKIAMNGGIGKMLSRYSALYDPKPNLQITINGQLLILKLCEMVEEIGGHILMANTDGIEARISRELQPELDKIFAKWQQETQLGLEFKAYKKLFIRDINNYIGLLENGSTYNKGAYEWKKYDEDGNVLIGWHKDHSMLCVPYAVQKFLVDGQSLMDSFRECPVDMFFIGKRAKSGGRFQIRHVDNIGLFGDEGSINSTFYGRTIRYLIVKKGGYLFKQEESAKKPGKIDAPWKVLDCMDLRHLNGDLEPLRPLIDYRYYEMEAKKLLSPILDKQTALL